MRTQRSERERGPGRSPPTCEQQILRRSSGFHSGGFCTRLASSTPHRSPLVFFTSGKMSAGRHGRRRGNRRIQRQTLHGVNSRNSCSSFHHLWVSHGKRCHHGAVLRTKQVSYTCPRFYRSPSICLTNRADNKSLFLDFKK